MNYSELMKIQSSIIEDKKHLKNIISSIDANGNRKLDSRYFLSAEVAAYKILQTLEKRMIEGNEIPEDINDTLQIIDEVTKGEYATDYDYYETECNMQLWEIVLKEEQGTALHNLNVEIITMASLAEVQKGYESPENSLIARISEEEVDDPKVLTYAYSIVHDWLMSLSEDESERIVNSGFGINANGSYLYKLHFNIFQ